METNQNAQEQSEQVQSSILTEDQVNQVVNPEGVKEEDVTLPSEESSIELPEKFQGKSAEEIAAAYLELEKKLGQPKQEEAPPAEESKEDAPTPPVTQDLLDEYIAKANEAGGLTEELYAELASKGYSKELVDTYAAGVQAKEQQKAVETLNKAGITPNEYQQAISWAKDNMSVEEITQYNDALASANESAIGILAKSLVDKYKSGNKQTQTYHSTDTQVQPKVKGYSDKSEMNRDISDPRYQKDARFNAMVAKKMAETEWL